MMGKSWVVIVLLTALGVVAAPAGLVSPAAAGDPGAPVSQTAPALSGTARVGSTLTADPGSWSPPAASYRYTWLRDGAVITTTLTGTRALTVTDRNHRISVRVVAVNEAGSSSPVTSALTPVVRSGVFAVTGKTRLSGARRWDHTLTAIAATTMPAATSVSYRWLREGAPIPGATERRYAVKVSDFGKHLEARVTLRRQGYVALTRSSGRTAAIGHRVPVRRSFTYSIATRGGITANVGAFASLAARTYADPRGWRAAGFAFRRVDHGGDFTLYLAAAGTVPGFGSPCSSMWSCRVGNSVIINQDRWQHASPAWNSAHLPLRDYRHMVVDHETGHWLGHRHSGCPGPGRPAPVMMQQSKGLNGCRFNPFPLPGERWTNR